MPTLTDHDSTFDLLDEEGLNHFIDRIKKAQAEYREKFPLDATGFFSRVTLLTQVFLDKATPFNVKREYVRNPEVREFLELLDADSHLKTFKFLDFSPPCIQAIRLVKQNACSNFENNKDLVAASIYGFLYRRV